MPLSEAQIAVSDEAGPDGTPDDGLVRAVSARKLRFADPREGRVDLQVAVERPVNIVYGSVPYAVMMMTPGDLEDFAYGFSLTEGIIEQPGEIRSIAAREEERGTVLTLDLTGDRFRRHLARQRSFAGRTGCGICGIDRLDDLPATGAAQRKPRDVPASAIESALAALEAHQPLNALTHAVHAAAWFSFEGRLVALREDVGRHNALDKLIGALLRERADPATGFVVVTSRCSYEMVEKAAVFGARAIVAVSAPTSLAIDRAEALGLALVAIARRDGAMIFTRPTGVEGGI